jgi:DNA-binding transcriptional LysR family regulator
VIELLRINTPRVALGMALTPILSELAWKHPRLTVEVYSDDALLRTIHVAADLPQGRTQALCNRQW